MMNAMTWQLLAVLLGSALLGLLIGLSIMRLRYVSKLRNAYHVDNNAVSKLSAERDALAAEKNSMLQALESEKKLAHLARDKNVQFAAQQETLKVHSDMQAQKLMKLQAELNTSEEKCIRLQRDFANFKANKLREVRMLKVSADEWLDNEELPVLNKKVDKISAVNLALEPLEGDDNAANLDLTQPIIASELDIPSLAESELPDSVDELEFELVDDDELR